MKINEFLDFIFILGNLKFKSKNIFDVRELKLSIEYGNRLSERIITFDIINEITDLGIFGVVNEIVDNFGIECLYSDNYFKFKIELFGVK